MSLVDDLRSRVDDLFEIGQSPTAVVHAIDVASLIENAANVIEAKDAMIAAQKRLIRSLYACLTFGVSAIVAFALVTTIRHWP